MEGTSSTANGPLAGSWSVWWIRVLLFIAHLTLLVAAASLTPTGYFFQLGEITGSVMVVGALFLWLLLWFARRRGAILLFCGLVLVQTGFVAFVARQFRNEDRLARELAAENTQRQNLWETQMANFHLNRAFEMLAPGSEFRPEELPELLEHARAANIANREQWAQTEAWANDGEKRLAAVNLRAAAEFRQGFESKRARNERVQELNRDYFTGIEKLVTLLIVKQGRYHSTKAGLAFDAQQDEDAYNEVLNGLNATQAKINAERRSDSPP